MDKIVEIDGELYQFDKYPSKIRGYTLNKLIKDTKMSALTQKEKDQRRGSKRRRKTMSAETSLARISGVQKILTLLNRATQGYVSNSREVVMQTVLAKRL
jgi:hypothetical protein